MEKLYDQVIAQHMQENMERDEVEFDKLSAYEARAHVIAEIDEMTISDLLWLISEFLDE